MSVGVSRRAFLAGGASLAGIGSVCVLVPGAAAAVLFDKVPTLFAMPGKAGPPCSSLPWIAAGRLSTIRPPSIAGR